MWKAANHDSNDIWPSRVHFGIIQVLCFSRRFEALGSSSMPITAKDLNLKFPASACIMFVTIRSRTLRYAKVRTRPTNKNAMSLHAVCESKPWLLSFLALDEWTTAVTWGCVALLALAPSSGLLLDSLLRNDAWTTAVTWGRAALLALAPSSGLLLEWTTAVTGGRVALLALAPSSGLLLDSLLRNDAWTTAVTGGRVALLALAPSSGLLLEWTTAVTGGRVALLALAPSSGLLLDSLLRNDAWTTAVTGGRVALLALAPSSGLLLDSLLRNDAWTTAVTGGRVALLALAPSSGLLLDSLLRNDAWTTAVTGGRVALLALAPSSGLLLDSLLRNFPMLPNAATNNPNNDANDANAIRHESIATFLCMAQFPDWMQCDDQTTPWLLLSNFIWTFHHCTFHTPQRQTCQINIPCTGA